MRRVAYVTPDSCGTGHAVRGAALVQAAGGVEVRAFGPVPQALTTEAPPPGEYEGSADWADRVRAWRPDLLVGDLAWTRLDWLRAALGVPAWLLVRWAPPDWLADRAGFRAAAWERRISIEPLSAGMAGITHAVAPVVVSAARFAPEDGQELRAGYNTYWEAVRFGYRDRVRWARDGSPEREARITLGGDAGCGGAAEIAAMAR